jgi:hypothetical protein
MTRRNEASGRSAGPSRSTVAFPALCSSLAGANQVKEALSPARDVQLSAALGCDPAWGQKTLQVTLHICKWPDVEVQQVEFDSRPVLNDGTQEIGKAFDKKWIKGRPDPATNSESATV